jgi:hypothetical protein
MKGEGKEQRRGGEGSVEEVRKIRCAILEFAQAQSANRMRDAPYLK